MTFLACLPRVTRVQRDVVVIGASAGGVEALLALVSELPADLPATILVVLHVSASHRSVLPDMLQKRGPLPARHARHGEPMRKGRIYVAPPDRHLIVRGSTLALVNGPRENGARPAIDPLFRSAARSLGPRVIGVVLSGALDDGTAGLQAIKRNGGLAIVQDPAEAIISDMPRHAMERVAVDHCLGIVELAQLLPALVEEKVEPMKKVSRSADGELRVALPGGDPPGAEGVPSAFSCPDCGGVLMELHDGEVLHFRCQIGHAFGIEALREHQEYALEGALWAALRALEEKGALARRMAARSRHLTHLKSADRFDDRAVSAERQAQLVRAALEHEAGEAPVSPAPAEKQAERRAKPRARQKSLRRGTRS